MLRKLILSAIAISLVAGSAALAQNGEPASPAAPEAARRDQHPILGGLDANNDGVIAADEFGGERLDMLRAADADGDGILTQEELVTYVMNREFQRRAERAARLLDIDGDGTVTIAEIEDHQRKRFALLDRNNDGQLSESELRRGGRAMHRMHRDGPRFAMRDGRHGHKFMHRMERMERTDRMERIAPDAPSSDAPARQ